MSKIDGCLVQIAKITKKKLYKLTLVGKNSKENKQFPQTSQKSLWNSGIAKGTLFHVY